MFKPIDNLNEFIKTGSNAILNTLQLSGGSTGQIIQATDNLSTLAFFDKYSNRVIEARPGTNTFSQAIQDATALNPTQTNPVSVILYTGEYIETGSTTIEIPQYVSVRSNTGGFFAGPKIILNGTIPAPNAFIKIRGLTFIQNISFYANRNAEICLDIDTQTQFSVAILFELDAYGGSLNNIVVRDQGYAFIVRGNYGTAFYNGITNNSDNTLLQLNGNSRVFITIMNTGNYTGIATPGLIGIQANGTSLVEGLISNPELCFIGFQFNDNSVGRIQSSSFLGALYGNEIAFQVNDSANLTVQSCDPVNWATELQTTSATCIINSSGTRFDTDKISLFNGANAINYFDTAPNNRGNHFLGNMLIGRRDGNTSTFLGEGSISVFGLSALKFNGVSFSDVSTTVKPESNTPVVLFDDLTNGIFYLGDDGKFSGFNYEVTQVEILGTGSAVWEYWNGVAWVEFQIMVTNFEAPYESYNIFVGTVIQKQNIRFDNQILVSGSTWSTATVNGINKYWVRHRITATITQSPAIKNIQFIGNITKINKDGFTEYFGTARSQLISAFDFNNILPLQGNIQNQTIWTAPTIGVARTNNSLTNGDKISFFNYLDARQSTDTPVEFLITFFSNGVDTDPFECKISYTCTGTGENIYLTSGAAVNPPKYFEQTFQLVPIINTNSRQVSAQIKLDGSLCSARTPAGQVSDVITVAFERLADLNANRLIIVNVSLIFLTAFSGLSQI